MTVFRNLRWICLKLNTNLRWMWGPPKLWTLQVNHNNWMEVSTNVAGIIKHILLPFDIFVIFRNDLNGVWIFTMVLMWMLVNQRRAIYCWEGVADLVWDCLEVQCGSYWFLNHFLNEKLNKIETENCIGIWEHFSWCCCKALWRVKFNRVYFTIFRAKVWKVLSFEWLCWKFNQIAKIGFGMKEQLSSQCVHIAKFTYVKNKECVHTWAKGIGYTSHQLVLSSKLL
jgi:hypothetical protein